MITYNPLDMKWRLPVGAIALLLCGILMLEFLSFNEYAALHKRIESNLAELLESQKSDLTDFGEQFSIYSNPFDISSNGDFKKRVFVNGNLVYWSDNAQIADYEALREVEDVSHLVVENSLYVVKKMIIPNRSALIEMYSLFPLIYTPPFSNQYLQKKVNKEVFESSQIRLENSASVMLAGLQLPIIIQSKPTYTTDVLIFVCCCLLIALLISNVLRWGKRRFSAFIWIGLVAIFLIIGRAALWFLTAYFLTIDLFDPVHYTSNLARSVGDLIFHSVFVLVFILIIFRYHSQAVFRPTSLWLFLVVCLCWNLAMMATSELVWNVLDNSLISLDISEKIHFDFLRSSFFLLLILWGASLFFLFVVFQRIGSGVTFKKWLIPFAYFPIALGASFFIQESGVWAIAIGGVAFVGVVLMDIRFHFEKFDYRAFLYLSLLLTATAFIYALVVYKHHEKDDLVAKKRFANRLLIKNDFLGEYYLNQKISEIKSDLYIRTRLGNPILAKRNVVEKIKRQYLSSYFDKYDIEVLLFDSEGEKINGSERNYSQLLNDFAQRKHATDYDQIFFVEDKEEYVQDRYYCFVPVSSFDITVGYVVLKMVLKKFIPRSVFPQLIVENSYYFSDDDKYDYAAYRQGKMLYKRGRFEFQNQLSYPDLVNDKLYEKGIIKDNTHFYGLETSEGKVFVIASPTFSKKAILSNFSFFYLLHLFLFGLCFIVIKLVHRGMDFNLSTKIQLYLGLSFLIPMLIVSIALLNTLNDTYKEEIDSSFSTKAYNISEYLTEVYDRFLSNQINRDELANAVSEASSLIQSDVNVYDPDGQLMISSEMEIFNVGLLGKQIDPDAYNAIKYGNAESKIYKQQIGDLVFSVAYVGLRSYKDGHLLGIMSMPYFDSKKHLIRQQIEVFNDLISVFTLIFLMSIVIGNLLIERLVRPLKMITERLKLTDLREINEPLAYESTDEIGALISEYNLMIVKLEQSKAALAESQKESAWKEIARQVAHEIKNPLTPMRLKIQQMMRQKEQGSQEYITLNSLIGQIDVLSSIADSFSAFARMPAPKNEKFDLLATLSGVLTLHRSTSVEIIVNFSIEPIEVYADPTIFSGIFNNIILNAIQSVKGRKATIEVSVSRKAKKVVISFKDNGAGIAEAHRDRIFTPYFSTKITGSGIGLAVAKKGIENAGGNIWFDTKEGGGTTFYISMPLVD